MTKFLLCLLSILPTIVNAAQCKGTDGNWYAYSHPMCSGGTSAITSKASDRWFSGGNLHEASVSQWRAAAYANKLATAADWLASTEWKGRLNTPADFSRLQVKAAMLVNAVDEVCSVDKTGDMSATEIAAAIMTLANDLGP